MSHDPPGFLYADHEGAVSLVHSYLTTQYDEIRFLSVAGPAETVKAVLAASKLRGTRLTLFRTHERASLHQSGREYAGSLHATASPSRLVTKRLPCGQAHGLLYPNITPSESPYSFTLVLPKTQEHTAPARLFRLIDVRTTLPLHPSWAPWLWRYCEENTCITPLTNYGQWVGWDIQWGEQELTKDLTQAVKERTLKIA